MDRVQRLGFAWAWGALLLVLIGVKPLQGQSAPVTALALTFDGRCLVGSDFGLVVCDATTLKQSDKIASQLEKTSSIRLSPDRSMFAVCGGTPAELGGVEVYSTVTLDRVVEFGPFDDIATDCCWVADDSLLAVSMTGNCCRLSIHGEAADPYRVQSKGILSVANLSSKWAIMAGLNHTITVQTLTKPAVNRVLNNHVDIVRQIAVRPALPDESDDRTALIASVSDDSTVRFWQPAIGRMIRFARLDSKPTCVCWNRQRTHVAVGTQSGMVYFVSAASAKITDFIQTDGWVDCLALDPTDQAIFIGGVSGLIRVDRPRD